MPFSNPVDHNSASRQQTLLLASDCKNTVLAELVADEARHTAYSVYGAQFSEQKLKTRLGFNGELREARIVWYILGNGYRAYNPGLMRFHSPDTLSPFGEGGLNAYMYCGGEPVMRKDRTGHSWFDVFANIWSALSPVGTGGAVAVQKIAQVKPAKQGGLSGVFGEFLNHLEINKKPPTVTTAKSSRTRKHVTFRDGPPPGQGSTSTTTSVRQSANRLSGVSEAGSEHTMSRASSQQSISSGSSWSSGVSAPSSYRTISTLSVHSDDSGFRSIVSDTSTFSGTSSLQARVDALRQN